jgi:polyketide synthase PksL
VLPAVAYLEMARAAIEDAMPMEQASMATELRHVGWTQPIVVTESKRVTVAVLAQSAEQIDFEIYSQDANGDEVMHCQGHCLLRAQRDSVKLDLSAIRNRMNRGNARRDELYQKFARMGLEYGPTFQGITALLHGTGELLVELTLPDRSVQALEDYRLHPSLMDSALQGSIGLIDDIVSISGRPPLPFALESLRILSECHQQMVAFVRYAEAGNSVSTTLMKVDIDLCDPEGHVCVQMRGFSSRPLEAVAAFDEAHYQSIVAGVLNRQLSADEAEALG